MNAGLGALLMYYGIKRRSGFGLLLIGTGAALVNRAVKGDWGVYRAMGLDAGQSDSPAQPEEYFEHGTQACCVISIDKPPAEVFRFWRDFSNLPKFMDTVRRVDLLDEKRSHWIVDGPAGVSVEWDAEIINEEPDKLIAWRSLGNSSVDNAGSVRFLQGKDGRGTDVHVVLDYIPPAGKLGVAAAKMFGQDAQGQLERNLAKLKEVMEKS